MSKAEERSKEIMQAALDYVNNIDDIKPTNEFGRNLCIVLGQAFITGVEWADNHQAEKDLLENKHETSWRLDEKLWKGIKDIEEASYQYMYDASNDWAYDIPTWNDVQDAFKAGSEWKEGLELTWEDIPKIFQISGELKTSWWFRDNDQTKLIGTQTFWEEVLKRFKERKMNYDKRTST